MAVMAFGSEDFKAMPVIVRDYANYSVAIAGKSKKTVSEYLLDIRTFLRFVKMRKSGDDLSREEFEKINISDVTIQDLQQISTQMIIEFVMYVGYERDNNPNTRMRKISAIKSLFKYLHAKQHLIDNDPAAAVEAPKQKKALPKHLTVEESVRLLQTVMNDTESKTRQRDYSIIALFLNTGMRLSELVGLDLQSFDSELTQVKVLGKGNKERMIYLNDAARRAVAAYLRIRLDPKYIRTSDNAFFLSARQKRISVKTVQWIIYKYLDMAGLGNKGLSVHKLRHTAATLMYQSGKVDIRVLKDILGHEQLNTTQIYTHVVSRNLEDAMYNNPLSDVIIKPSKTDSADD